MFKMSESLTLSMTVGASVWLGNTEPKEKC